MMSLVLRAERDQAKIVKEATKQANRECSINPSLDYNERYKFWFTMEKRKATSAINGLCDLLEDEEYSSAMERLTTIVANKANNLKLTSNKQWYFITIRPDDKKCTISEFYSKIQSTITRSCFIEGSYSLEQKGLFPEELGQGFHCHIVANMKQASKGQVLRDLKSSFSSWIKDGLIADNCIDVKPTKNPDDVIEKYLIEYESDDGHKEKTRAMDELWRTMEGLKRIYKF